MGSAKIIMTLYVRWKNLIKQLIELDPEDLQDAGDKGKPAPPVSISPQEIEKMKKSRLVVKNKLNEWHDLLPDYVPKPIKNAVGKAFLRAKNNILRPYDGVKKTLKGGVGNQKQTEDNTDLITHENEGDPDDNYRVEIPFNILMSFLRVIISMI